MVTFADQPDPLPVPHPTVTIDGISDSESAVRSKGACVKFAASVLALAILLGSSYVGLVAAEVIVVVEVPGNVTLKKSVGARSYDIESFEL